MCLSTSSIHLASYVGFPPLASPQLLAFMLFQYLHPCASQQLPACIWFQYLGFPCPSTTHCAHLASISNFPPMRLSSNFPNFLHSLGFNIYTLQGVRRPSPCDTLGFPPPSHSALFFSISALHTSSGLSVTKGLNLVNLCESVGAFI